MRVASLIAFAVIFLLGVAPAAAADPVSLTVSVSGAQPNTGQAICALFDSPENYLKQPLRLRAKAIGPNGNVACRFDDLDTGTYAVSVVYDEDRNGELNTGFLGVPTELVGMSNNAKGLFGPPSFEAASFALSKPLTIEIRLGRAKD